MSIKIVLADNHKLMRDGLKALLEKHTDMEVIAEAADGRELLRLIGKLAPDVAVVDVVMPNLNGIEAVRQITAQFPEVKVVALSMHLNKQFVVGMLRAGASAYLVKDCAFGELHQAISAVVANHTYLSPRISDTVVEQFLCNSSSSTDHHGPSALTPREREILQLLAEGKDTNQLAAQLHVSVKTVGTHRQHIMSKLKIHSLAELTKYAIREGITSL